MVDVNADVDELIDEDGEGVFTIGNFGYFTDKSVDRTSDYVDIVFDSE